jgi:hypothetical protein
LNNTGQSILGVTGTPGADIAAPPAWDVTTGGTAVVVAVIDTGIDYTHPDLAANVWTYKNPENIPFTVIIGGQPVECQVGTHGFNAITHSCDPMDDHSHGTHVSGTIGAAGNNGIGVAGVNWQGSIMGARFLDATGSGYLSDAVEAMDFVIQVKQLGLADVRVMSNSWGGGGYSQTLYNEIQKANANDILFVAAAGNAASDNDQTPSYPAGYSAPNVISVAATDNRDSLASFSNYGPTTVHLGAPGVNVLSTIPGGGYAYYSGTSMATPHVSGAAALVLSGCPALSTAQLKEDILGNVDPVPSLTGKTVTGGRLDVSKAIIACSGPARTPTATTLTASPDLSTYGDPITFTATVAPAGVPETPTGTVTFSDGGFSLGTGALSGGVATFTTSSLSGGLHSITATYGGDAVFSRSTSPALPYTVDKAGSSATLSTSAISSTFGDPVTFTATVSPADATGLAFFSEGRTEVGYANISQGTGSLTTTTLAAGTHTVTVMYIGNSNYLGSTSDPVSVDVSMAGSATSLSASPNPSTAGQPVTFTALVTPPAVAGTVTFYDGAGQLGTGNLSAGRAAFSTSGLSVGDHAITATYAGNPNVIGSTSPAITQTVTGAPPADFTLSASPSGRTVARGGSTTYTVSVTRLSGFSGKVSLTLSGLPSRATASFNPTTITAPGTSSTLMVKTKPNTPIGTYPLTITGSGGSITHRVTVTLVVQRTLSGFSSRATGAGSPVSEDAS